MHQSPLAPTLERQGFVIIDGGLSTELERQGHDLNHSLWSARLLAEDPGAILRAHRAFLDAGANCIISSSYQATPQGLLKHGFSAAEARALMLKSWELARVACEQAASVGTGRTGPAPTAAASIGPYGAYLADGSEYRGDYGLSVDALVEFHRERFDLLAPVAPLLAFETIPCLEEAEAIRRLLTENPAPCAWVTFSCRDGEHIACGHTIEEAASVFDDLPQVIAVGVNCTEPEHVGSLIRRLRARGGAKEIIVYPNSGEAYCAETKTWSEGSRSQGLASLAPTWHAAGARLIGGCCRVAASELREIADALR
ncbi:MAG: homocysteine S-methyltransferase [Planctomycetota bacterium]|jgi:homocysteine S-methyltransferase